MPAKKVIVLAVDGMDPGFVERHWADLPNLSGLRDHGTFSRLETTNPPQSPVAWATFITGLDPAQHGIFDFVQRDAATGEAYLSTTRTIEPRFHLPFGPYELPLSRSKVVQMRKGRPFWEFLADRGIPVTIMRLPSNYPPSVAGRELAGMGTPDLRGTEGTFTYFTGNAADVPGEVPGGFIRRANGKYIFDGPPNTLRKDHAYGSTSLTIDADPVQPWVRLKTDEKSVILKEGEWSGWLRANFPLIPHVVDAHGMFRVFLKRVHPDIEVYVSPVNIDPEDPALPISAPASFASAIAKRIGRWPTLGIPEDTAALRQGVFDLPQFLAASRMVLNDERRLLEDSLNQYKDGLLIFYFSAVDQNSHMLWGKHDDELLGIYREVDAAIGRAIQREPDAEIIVLSDHGFTFFDRAVHLNRWLALRGFAGKAFALGLNGLYVNDRAILPALRRQLLEFRDPENGRPVITRVDETHSSPDLLVGYAQGYRASWQTAAGEAPNGLIEDNDDAWIADHCVDPSVVPGVLFLNKAVSGRKAALKDIPVLILHTYAVPPPASMGK